MANQNQNQQQQSAPKSGQRLDVEIRFPAQGINESSSHNSQPPGTTFDALNVLTYDAEEGRGRGGRRPGLFKRAVLAVSERVRLLDTINVLGVATGGVLAAPISYIDKFFNRRASVVEMMEDADPLDDDTIPVGDQAPLMGSVIPHVVETQYINKWIDGSIEANWDAGDFGPADEDENNGQRIDNPQYYSVAMQSKFRLGAYVPFPLDTSSAPSLGHTGNWIRRPCETGDRLVCVSPIIKNWDTRISGHQYSALDMRPWDPSVNGYLSETGSLKTAQPWGVSQPGWSYWMSNWSRANDYSSVNLQWMYVFHFSQLVQNRAIPPDQRPVKLYVGGKLNSDLSAYLPLVYTQKSNALWFYQSQDDLAFNSCLDKNWACTFSLRVPNNGGQTFTDRTDVYSGSGGHFPGGSTESNLLKTNWHHKTRYSSYSQSDPAADKLIDYRNCVAVVNSSTNAMRTDIKFVDVYQQFSDNPNSGFGAKCSVMESKMEGVVFAANLSVENSEVTGDFYDDVQSKPIPALFIGYKLGLDAPTASGPFLSTPADRCFKGRDDPYGGSSSQQPSSSLWPSSMPCITDTFDDGSTGRGAYCTAFVCVGDYDEETEEFHPFLDDSSSFKHHYELVYPAGHTKAGKPVDLYGFNSFGHGGLAGGGAWAGNQQRNIYEDTPDRFDITYRDGYLQVFVNEQRCSFKTGDDQIAELGLYGDPSNESFIMSAGAATGYDTNVLGSSRRYTGVLSSTSRWLDFDNTKIVVTLNDNSQYEVDSDMVGSWPGGGEIEFGIGGTAHYLYFNDYACKDTSESYEWIQANQSQDEYFSRVIDAVADSYPETYAKASESNPAGGRRGFFRGDEPSWPFVVGEWVRCKYFAQLGFRSELGADWLRSHGISYITDLKWVNLNEATEGIQRSLAITPSAAYVSIGPEQYKSSLGEMSYGDRALRTTGTVFFDKYYFSNFGVYELDPSANTFSLLTDRIGDEDGDPSVFPGGQTLTSDANYPTLVSKFLSRLVLSGKGDEPNNWWMSGTGDPYAWDTGAEGLSDSGPIAGNSSRLAEIGDPIRAIFPLHDTKFVFGCSDSIFMLDDDPGAPGVQFLTLSQDIGIVSHGAYCFGVNKTLYFFGQDGLYRLAPNENNITNYNKISTGRFDREFQAVDHSSNNVQLIYDHTLFGVHVLLCPSIAPLVATEHFFYDERNDAFWKMEYPAQASPSTAFYRNSSDLSVRGLMVGTHDGEIWGFKNDATDDAGEPINSHVWLGPYALGTVTEVKLVRLSAVLDSNSSVLAYSIHVADTAEEAKQSPAVITSTWGAGRNAWQYDRARGAGIFVRVYQSGDSYDPWALESITATLAVAGQARVRS